MCHGQKSQLSAGHVVIFRACGNDPNFHSCILCQAANNQLMIGSFELTKAPDLLERIVQLGPAKGNIKLFCWFATTEAVAL